MKQNERPESLTDSKSMVEKPGDIEVWNRELAQASFDEILRFAYTHLGDEIVVTSSFQTQSLPLLHMISKMGSDIPIVFLDTGFHFEETLAFRDELMGKWDLNVISTSKTLNHSEFLRLYGPLYKKNVDKCCHINKTIPLRSVLEHYNAWISGVRSDQTQLRQGMKIFNLQKNGKIKICPLINWTERDVYKYISRNNIKEHPLMKEGYMSVGCKPCTSPVFGESDSRSGRWQGQVKTECGIHKEEE